MIKVIKKYKFGISIKMWFGSLFKSILIISSWSKYYYYINIIIYVILKNLTNFNSWRFEEEVSRTSLSVCIELPIAAGCRIGRTRRGERDASRRRLTDGKQVEMLPDNNRGCAGTDCARCHLTNNESRPTSEQRDGICVVSELHVISENQREGFPSCDNAFRTYCSSGFFLSGCCCIVVSHWMWRAIARIKLLFVGARHYLYV